MTIAIEKGKKYIHRGKERQQNRKERPPDLPEMPLNMAYLRSDIYSAEKDRTFAPDEVRERDRLHVIVLARSGGPAVPVCMGTPYIAQHAGDPGVEGRALALGPRIVVAAVIAGMVSLFLHDVL